MLAYAGRLLRLTGQLLFVLFAIGVVLVLFIVLFDYVGLSIGAFVVSWTGVLFATGIATTYFLVRKVLV